MRKWLLTLTLMLSLTNVHGASSDGALPREVVVNGVEFVLVPEGWFWYAVGLEKKQRLDKSNKNFRDVKIWLDGFYMAKYEARARDLKRFMDSRDVQHRGDYADGETAGCALRRNPDGEYVLRDKDRDLPATHLTWRLADEFARWMGFRLPTEVEWEKAARGEDKRLFPWGNEYPDDTFAGFGGQAACNPSPVSAFSNGKSPYGIYNMAGNVFEFVADWYNDEHDMALSDGMRNPPLATAGTLGNRFSTTADGLSVPQKVLKGGRWSSDPDGLTLMSRALHPPESPFVCFGTRFALDVASVRDHLAKGTARVIQP